MIPRRRAGAPAFTLIELLVVVSIIAVLISILLPALSRAREQAKMVKCVANLGSIGKAMHMYFGDHKDWFPFEKSNWPESNGNPGNTFVLSAFHYAGHPGRPSEGDQYSFTFDRPLLRDTFRGRPFNRYMIHPDNLLDRLEQPSEAGTPEFEERRKELTITQCPSDIGGFFSNQTAEDTGQYRAIWELHGSSYDINYHFVWLWAARAALGGPIPRYTPPPPIRRRAIGVFTSSGRTGSSRVSVKRTHPASLCCLRIRSTLHN